MARLCCDKRAEVRTQALNLLQRSLLVPDLQVPSSLTANIFFFFRKNRRKKFWLVGSGSGKYTDSGSVTLIPDGRCRSSIILVQVTTIFKAKSSEISVNFVITRTKTVWVALKHYNQCSGSGLIKSGSGLSSEFRNGPHCIRIRFHIPQHWICNKSGKSLFRKFEISVSKKWGWLLQLSTALELEADPFF